MYRGLCRKEEKIMKRLSCLFLAGTLLCGLLSACTRPVSNGELPANADTTAPAAISVELGTPTPTPTPSPSPTPTEIPSVTVDGASIRADAVELNVKSLAALEQLDAFPLLERVDASAVLVDLATMQRLAERYPSIEFSFQFTYRELTLSSTDTELDLNNIPLDGTKEILDILPFLNKLEKCFMIGCGLTNEQMDELLAARPDVKFVWEIQMGDHVLRTDVVGFSTKNPSKYYNESSSADYIEKVKKTRRLYDEDIAVLKYCTDLVALDLGHNYITDLSVLACLPKLQILILADNKLTDISVLKELPDLVYVEIFMNAITDLSPLAGHDKLLDLNFCNNDVLDLSVLYTLPQLERVWCAGNAFSRADGAALQAALPDCKVNYTARDDTADGWREHERYQWVLGYMKRDNNPYNPS